MRRLLSITVAAVLAVGMSGCGQAAKESAEPKKEPAAKETTAEATKELNVYSSRHYDVDKKLYDKFTEETGVKVNVVEGKGPELVERLVREKDAPEADLFVTVGAESISQLNDEGVLGEYSSETIEKNIPEQYRGDGWMGMSSRARVVAYVKDQVDPSAITSYEDLTKPEWKGQILVRPSESSYNQALVASFVDTMGKDKAKEWAQGVTDNMAREPKGNDRDQAKAIVAGEGKLAIMNSYYWVKLKNSSDPEEQKVAEKIDLIFPKDTHVNLSYAGVIKGGKNSVNAVKFMEFLTSSDIQTIIAEDNGEFPLNPETTVPEPQKSWLGFTPQKIDYATLGKHIPEATEIFTEVGWK
ncbi:MAG: extracellular solute-binding protein [Actinomycetaceae bacterium]|nr:extracellular solute-binding protein [Actinomycetaceae bacterium]